MGKRSRKSAWKKLDTLDEATQKLQDASEASVQASRPDDALFYTDNQGHESHRVKRARRKLNQQQQDKHDNNNVVMMADASAPKPKRAKIVPLKPVEVALKKRHKNRSKHTKKTSAWTVQQPAKAKRSNPMDIWGEQEKDTETVKVTSGSFVVDTSHRPKRAKGQRNVSQDKIQATLLKSSLQPAADGASFNPTSADHDKLIQDSFELQQAQTKADRDAYKQIMEMRKVNEGFKEKAQGELVDEFKAFAADAEDQHDSQSSSDSDSDDSDPESNGYFAHAPISRDNRKTRPQRNKERAHQALMKSQKDAKQAKRTGQEMKEVKRIRREKRALEAQQAADRAELAQSKEVRGKLQPKLGKNRFEKAKIDFSQPEDVSSSLREVKPVGDLLGDQLKRFEAQGLIETRQKLKYRRRYRKKEYERVKDWKIDIERKMFPKSK